MALHNHHIPTAKEILDRYAHLSDAEKAVHLANIINLLYVHEKKLLKLNQVLINFFKKGGFDVATRKRASRFAVTK